MERIFKFSTVAIALFFATNSFATIYPIVNAGDAKSIIIDLNDWNTTDVNIIIRDYNGEILHNDGFAKGSVHKRKYNLENLPSGRYTLTIQGANKKAITPVEVSGNQVFVKTTETVITYKPVFKVTDDAIELNYLALGEQVVIAISDDREVFFSKVYKGANTINTSFNISDLPRGEYVISLATDHQFESFEFKK